MCHVSDTNAPFRCSLCVQGVFTSVSEMENSIFHTVSSFVESTFRSGLTRAQGHRLHGVVLILINVLLRAKLFSLFASVLHSEFSSSLCPFVVWQWSWGKVCSLKILFCGFGSYCHQSRLGRGPRFGSHCALCEVSVSSSMSLSAKQTNAQILWKTHRSPQSRKYAPIIHPHRQSDVVFQQGWVISDNTQCTIGSCLGIPELWNEHWNKY